MTEPDTIVCERLSPFSKSVPGSIESTCVQCSQPIWIAPTGQELLRRRPDVARLCTVCAMPVILAGNTEFAALPGAMDELRAVEGQEAVDYAEDFLVRLRAAQRRTQN